MPSPPRRPSASRPKGREAASPRPRIALGSRPQIAAEGAESRAVVSIRRVLVVGSVALLLAILLGPTLKNYLDQRSQIGALQQRVTEQQANVSALEHEKSLWANPEYVEQQARKRLKFVKVGEKAYSIIDADPTEAAATPEQVTGPGAATHPWYGQLWESVKVADNPQRAATG